MWSHQCVLSVINISHDIGKRHKAKDFNFYVKVKERITSPNYYGFTQPEGKRGRIGRDRKRPVILTLLQSLWQLWLLVSLHYDHERERKVLLSPLVTGWDGGSWWVISPDWLTLQCFGKSLVWWFLKRVTLICEITMHNVKETTFWQCLNMRAWYTFCKGKKLGSFALLSFSLFFSQNISSLSHALFLLSCQLSEVLPSFFPYFFPSYPFPSHVITTLSSSSPLVSPSCRKWILQNHLSPLQCLISFRKNSQQAKFPSPVSSNVRSSREEQRNFREMMTRGEVPLLRLKNRVRQRQTELIRQTRHQDKEWGKRESYSLLLNFLSQTMYS